MNSPPFSWPYSVSGMGGPAVATPPPPEAFPPPQPQPQPPPQVDGHLSSPPYVDLDSPQSLMADGSDLPLHDVTTLRFFYNLGVNVFNTVRKATQSPVLAMHDNSSSQVDGSPFISNHADAGRGVLQVDAPSWQPQPRKEASAHAHGLQHMPGSAGAGGFMLPLSSWSTHGMAPGSRELDGGQAMRGPVLPCMPLQLVCSPDGVPCALPVVYMPPQHRNH